MMYYTSYRLEREEEKNMARKAKEYKITSRQIFDTQKPKYNGFAGGYGAHGDSKYNRNKEKREFRRELER